MYKILELKKIFSFTSVENSISKKQDNDYTNITKNATIRHKADIGEEIHSSILKAFSHSIFLPLVISLAFSSIAMGLFYWFFAFVAYLSIFRHKSAKRYFLMWSSLVIFTILLVGVLK